MKSESTYVRRGNLLTKYLIWCVYYVLELGGSNPTKKVPPYIMVDGILCLVHTTTHFRLTPEENDDDGNYAHLPLKMSPVVLSGTHN